MPKYLIRLLHSRHLVCSISLRIRVQRIVKSEQPFERKARDIYLPESSTSQDCFPVPALLPEAFRGIDNGHEVQHA
jgi:hypothetical protein